MTSIPATFYTDSERNTSQKPEKFAGVLRTPLVKLRAGHSKNNIYLKLENLQPIGSFKIRGATNAVMSLSPAELNRGIYTLSAGNMAQGLAMVTQKLGIRCHVVVPDHAPAAKVDAIMALGASVEKISFAEWWQGIENQGLPGRKETFVHPFADERVIDGNATLAIELHEDLADIDEVIIPFGGGGLLAGVGKTIRKVQPSCQVTAVEVKTAAPLYLAMQNGQPSSTDYQPSFVDGIGSNRVAAVMWPLIQEIQPKVEVVRLEEIADAIRLLATSAKIVAEGAGAASLAAALRAPGKGRNIVAIISGGCINSLTLAQILSGDMPK